MPIPNIMHAIWLGSFPPEDALNNILEWKKCNPKEKANLWIDSRLYPATEKTKFLADLEAWSKKNGVRIRDLGGSDHAFYQQMRNKEFYDEEIKQPNANFGAAADILRIEFLYREGGKYYDIRDVFPGSVSVSDLEAEFGFLCRIQDNQTYFCNDVMASEARGKIVLSIREGVHNCYQALYKDPKKVKAHRENCDIDDPQGRKISTINTSGAITMMKALDAFAAELLIKEEQKKDYLKYSLPKIGIDAYMRLSEALKEKVEFAESRGSIHLSQRGIRHVRQISAALTFPAQCYKLAPAQKNDWLQPQPMAKESKSVDVTSGDVPTQFYPKS